ncbi:MAG: hypothetical protein Ct9H300mP6_07060 [Gammaproteobacteria bacterium]|nr:MAG: hypothetical protein Ct9H300mP6_07060 [Gammaproteobacteria bacterium]
MNKENKRWVLITGGPKGKGAMIARTLHLEGMNLIIHYNTSSDDANNLCAELNSSRTDSAIALVPILPTKAKLKVLNFPR